MKKNDGKYFYTAQLMNEALLSLLERKDIEFITVTEITKKAGVNRSTFYLHYDNVYELLEETIENLNKTFVSSFDNLTPAEITSQGNAFLLTEEILKAYLNFCKEHKRLLKLVYQKPHLFKNDAAYRKMYTHVLYPAISQFVKQENQRVYMLEYFTQGVVGIIHKWIELDCVTEIYEIVEIIRSCVGYGYENK